MWWVPVLVFVVSFGAAVLAAARWLPALARGPVGGLAFFAVCGLLGAAGGLAGLRIYSTVRELETAGGGGPFDSKGELLAQGLSEILFDCGLLSAAALAVFLLAPREAMRPQDPET